MKQQQPANKQKAIDFAVALEAKTAAARGSDDLVCRDGMAQMRAELERGNNMRSRTECAGSAWVKTVAVEAPSDWRPTILPEQNYIPKQEVARAKLKAMLAESRHVSAGMIDGRDAQMTWTEVVAKVWDSV